MGPVACLLRGRETERLPTAVAHKRRVYVWWETPGGAVITASDRIPTPSGPQQVEFGRREWCWGRTPGTLMDWGGNSPEIA